MAEIPIELLTTAALDGCARVLSGPARLSDQTPDTQVLWDSIQPIAGLQPTDGGDLVDWSQRIEARSYLHRWMVLDCIRACEVPHYVPETPAWDSRRTYLNTARNWVSHPCFSTTKNARMHQNSGAWDIRLTNQAICSKGSEILDKALGAHAESGPDKSHGPWSPQISQDAKQRALQRFRILFSIQDRLPNPAPLIVLK